MVDRPTLYCEIDIGPASRPTQPSHPVSDTPYSQLSLAGTEAYTTASTRDAADADDADEYYVSSHFADEPLYQFYTAAIIKVE